MRILPPLLGLIVAAGSAFAQNSAYHSFTSPPLGTDVDWPPSILDTHTLDPISDYDGLIEIENQTNNPIFFDDNYVATGNSPLIDSDAMWGNPRTGAPLGDPELRLNFSYFFNYDSETGSLVDQATEVSFDFAWASSEFGATIDTLEIEIEDYWGDTEVQYVELGDTFDHGIGGNGEGYTGHVALIPESVENIYAIRIRNLYEGDSGGFINEFALDNLSVGGAGPPPGELGPVEFDGQPVTDYGTNALKNTGLFGIGENVFNGTSAPTTFSVIWDSSSPLMYQPQPMMNVSIAPGATAFNAVRWEINTDTAPSGEYNGTFTIRNEGDPGDPDDTLEVIWFRLYDPPVLTGNSGTPLAAPGGQATISNAAAGGHPGALRASVKVTEVLQTNSRFSVSGIATGSALNPGGTLTGNIHFKTAGAPSGPQTGLMRVKLEMFGSPQSYLNDRTPVADRVWPLTFNVPPVPEATPEVTLGEELADAGLAISGENSGAEIIGGVSASDQTVSLAFAPAPPAPNPAGVGTAAVLNFGTSTSLYVLQLSYADLAAGFAEQDLRIHAFSPPSGPWVPAISLNGNAGATVSGAAPFAGTYTQYLATLGGNALDAADLGAFGIDASSNTAWVVLDYHGTFQLVTGPNTAPPRILGIAYDESSNTTTLTYQSVSGVSFEVQGGDLTGLAPIGTTPAGTGGVMEYQHSPPGAPSRYFYRLSRP